MIRKQQRLLAAQQREVVRLSCKLGVLESSLHVSQTESKTILAHK